MASPTLIAVAGSFIVLYILIKGHIYVTKRLWKPVFEEEVEKEQSSEDEPGPGGESVEENDEEEVRVRQGWDEVG